MFTLRLKPPARLENMVSHKAMQVSYVGDEIGWTRTFKIKTDSSGFYTYVWIADFQDLLNSMIITHLRIELGQEI